MTRKRADQIEQGDRIVRRYANSTRAFEVELVSPFIGIKNRAMIHVKAGNKTFDYRIDDMVEIYEED